MSNKKTLEDEIKFILKLKENIKNENFKDVLKSLYESDNISSKAYDIACEMYGLTSIKPKMTPSDDPCSRTVVRMRSGC